MRLSRHSGFAMPQSPPESGEVLASKAMYPTRTEPGAKGLNVSRHARDLFAGQVRCGLIAGLSGLPPAIT